MDEIREYIKCWKYQTDQVIESWKLVDKSPLLSLYFKHCNESYYELYKYLISDEIKNI